MSEIFLFYGSKANDEEVIKINVLVMEYQSVKERHSASSDEKNTVPIVNYG